MRLRRGRWPLPLPFWKVPSGRKNCLKTKVNRKTKPALPLHSMVIFGPLFLEQLALLDLRCNLVFNGIIHRHRPFTVSDRAYSFSTPTRNFLNFLFIKDNRKSQERISSNCITYKSEIWYSKINAICQELTNIIDWRKMSTFVQKWFKNSVFTKINKKYSWTA